MTITVSKESNWMPYPVPLKEAVSQRIRSDGLGVHSQGRLEELDAQVDRMADVVSVLADAMNRAGLLTLDEVNRMIPFDYTATEPKEEDLVG